MNEFLKRMFLLTMFILLFTMIYTIIFGKKYYWKGLEEEDENNMFEIFLNRLYFTTTTISTAGFGDISPKNNYLKIVVILCQLIMIYQIIETITSLQ